MNTRVVLEIAVALTMSCVCVGQQPPQPIDAAAASIQQQLKQNVAADETAVQAAEAAHATDAQLARLYSHLGFSYEVAAEFGLSEAALTHSITLFRRVPADDEELATTLNSLVVLHTAMGKFRQADKEAREAMRLREKLGDRLQLAESWSTFAALSLKQHKNKQALDYAERSVAEFRANAQADERERIVSEYTLGMALYKLKNSAQGLEVFKAAVAEATATLPAHDFTIGHGRYLMGLAYWKTGDMADAGRELQAGVTALREQLGWGHPTYVTALRLYEQYLRQARQVEAADVVERQIQQAQAVVDVHALQSGGTAPGFEGLR